jgi:hypothetical protein
VTFAVYLIEGLWKEHEGNSDEGCHYKPELDFVLELFVVKRLSSTTVSLIYKICTVFPIFRGILIIVVIIDGAMEVFASQLTVHL